VPWRRHRPPFHILARVNDWRFSGVSKRQAVHHVVDQVQQIKMTVEKPAELTYVLPENDSAATKQEKSNGL
jgi:hypothetical protein